tara:strand:+ start:260 stop:532 length:273 start_codon:yes stop_codon:yes gene_type:complete
MTQKEMIEIIQQHHPDINETAIRKALNRAQDDFAAKTKILRVASNNADTTVADQRYYSLPPELLEVKRVELDEVAIQRLIDRPIKGDYSS